MTGPNVPVAPFSDDGPRISCLMVTADRRALARRSVNCFLAQRYPNRELVIVDDGTEDYAPILAAVPPERLIYHRISKDAATTLGELRNLTLELARGDVIAQWDDDDWFDAERLPRQLAALGDKAAVWMPATLMHLDDPAWLDRPYVSFFQGGAPSTVVHRRRDDIRYPAERKGEDSTYRDAWRALGHRIMPVDDAGLLIRCFHGKNTWDRDHFERRLALRPGQIVEWRLRRLTRTTAGYSAFRLSDRQHASFDAFAAQSRALGLF
jgi:glycosyltransferase involved in cell wall biosynthesis